MCHLPLSIYGFRKKHGTSNIGTKCNSLTQQFIGISTTVDTWATTVYGRDISQYH